jgi:hypothetical protein
VGTLNEDQYSFWIISHSVLLRMRSVSDKSCRDNRKHFMFSNFFGHPAIYEIMWNNSAEPGMLQVTIWCKCFAYWIPKSINAHSKYVTHCFSTATMVAWTYLNVTLYVHCLSCSNLNLICKFILTKYYMYLTFKGPCMYFQV